MVSGCRSREAFAIHPYSLRCARSHCKSLRDDRDVVTFRVKAKLRVESSRLMTGIPCPLRSDSERHRQLFPRLRNCPRLRSKAVYLTQDLHHLLTSVSSLATRTTFLFKFTSEKTEGRVSKNCMPITRIFQAICMPADNS